jgi:hypothetical protein
MDNSYNWALTLASMSESDFSNLSSDQKAALDHVTSFSVPKAHLPPFAMDGNLTGQTFPTFSTALFLMYRLV